MRHPTMVAVRCCASQDVLVLSRAALDGKGEALRCVHALPSAAQLALQLKRRHSPAVCNNTLHASRSQTYDSHTRFPSAVLAA